MEINEYQNKALQTAVYPGQNTKSGVEYTLFGLLGEAGELANLYKKILRKEENPYGHREKLADELGDVFWYACAFAKEIGYSLDEIAVMNNQKLAARQQAGALKDHA